MKVTVIHCCCNVYDGRGPVWWLPLFEDNRHPRGKRIRSLTFSFFSKASLHCHLRCFILSLNIWMFLYKFWHVQNAFLSQIEINLASVPYWESKLDRPYPISLPTLIWNSGLRFTKLYSHSQRLRWQHFKQGESLWNKTLSTHPLSFIAQLIIDNLRAG